MKITKIKSMHPTNEFAPVWNIPMYSSLYDDYEKVEKIKNFLIKKETELVNGLLPGRGDGRTGLGLNSVTSKYGMYNVFDFIQELPELNDLLNFLRISYIDFVLKNQSRIHDCYIVCWYNIVRAGQDIKKHSHGTGHSSYLSANMHLDNYETTTDYHVPFDDEVIHKLPNQTGGLTIFPSYLPHSVGNYNGENLRVSIGFDLHLEKPNDLESIIFIDQEILNKVGHLFNSEGIITFMDDEMLNRLTNPSNEAII